MLITIWFLGELSFQNWHGHFILATNLLWLCWLASSRCLPFHPLSLSLKPQSVPLTENLTVRVYYINLKHTTALNPQSLLLLYLDNIPMPSHTLLRIFFQHSTPYLLDMCLHERCYMERDGTYLYAIVRYNLWLVFRALPLENYHCT